MISTRAAASDQCIPYFLIHNMALLPGRKKIHLQYIHRTPSPAKGRSISSFTLSIKSVMVASRLFRCHLTIKGWINCAVVKGQALYDTKKQSICSHYFDYLPVGVIVQSLPAFATQDGPPAA
jgi:hypothetical protein